MYELIKISEDSYYIQCPAKIGIFKIKSKLSQKLAKGSRLYFKNSLTVARVRNVSAHLHLVTGLVGAEMSL